MAASLPSLPLIEAASQSGTIEVDMEFLLHFAVNLITFLFFVGLAGSSIVVLLSFVEDLHELMGE